MTLPFFQVDAFTSALFGGNPAAVIPLEAWLPDALMQSIAQENNLSETAFFVPKEGKYEIRWFTPTTEVALCGHATLASAHVLFNELGYEDEQVLFLSESGELAVNKKGNLLELDFPSQPPVPAEMPEGLAECFNFQPAESFQASEDFLLVFENEEQIAGLSPDFSLLAKIPVRGIICTAKGNEVDFVSRFFAPASGIAEDPVTGSAHTRLIPFWAGRLGKNTLKAWQISARKGQLLCGIHGDRVFIGGEAVTYLSGSVYL